MLYMSSRHFLGLSLPSSADDTLSADRLALPEHTVLQPQWLVVYHFNVPTKIISDMLLHIVVEW